MMAEKLDLEWHNTSKIHDILIYAAAPPDNKIQEALDHAREAQGLSLEEAAALSYVRKEEHLEQLFTTAKELKQKIYGPRVVLFAPMYISNLCRNECSYCAFRKSNHELTRRALTQDEIAQETILLVNQGHKRALVVAGESPDTNHSIDYILRSIDTIYKTKGDKPGAEIRRINANLAPLSLSDFGLLKKSGIGTYQLFQETYHDVIYDKVHVKGAKKDMGWRLSALDRAMQSGIDDVGMGVLLGLAPWRFDMIGMMQHIQHLENKFGVGCHTISVPRLEPAHGSYIASHPLHPVSDTDFKKLVAILRLAVPYTGIIMSTRENPEMRRETLELGVSQISAGSRTNPGGYAAAAKETTETFNESQFQLGDHRSLAEVTRELATYGYTPSFCTACYRLGRTGDKFMEWAKTGEIHHMCDPNALSTFQEYLIDYAAPDVRKAGEQAITNRLGQMPQRDAKAANLLLTRVRAGQRDCFC